MNVTVRTLKGRAVSWGKALFAAATLLAGLGFQPAFASEANLRLPAFTEPLFFGGSTTGASILTLGLAVAALGLLFGLSEYRALRGMPVHKSMLEISDLIYETCKQYLVTQGKFILVLEVFIGAVIVLYFGVLMDDPAMTPLRVAVIPAVSRSPRPDPLFLLAGGPGQAATEAFPAEIGAFERINQTRDLVLVDQRGTGGSSGVAFLKTALDRYFFPELWDVRTVL